MSNISQPIITETNNKSIVDNILNELNTNNVQQNINQDPNNKPPVTKTISKNKYKTLFTEFKLSIISGILIILFSFPQINKLGKIILRINFINNLKISYVFP